MVRRRSTHSLPPAFSLRTDAGSGGEGRAPGAVAMFSPFRRSVEATDTVEASGIPLSSGLDEGLDQGDDRAWRVLLAEMAASGSSTMGRPGRRHEIGDLHVGGDGAVLHPDHRALPFGLQLVESESLADVRQDPAQQGVSSGNSMAPMQSSLVGKGRAVGVDPVGIDGAGILEADELHGC